MTPDTERYYRDVYDHLIRISDLIDSYRDLLTGAMDVYLSTVSNRLNDVMKRLTIVATIFMPLTWITGFFGMNFGWLVLNVTGWLRLLRARRGDAGARRARHARPVPAPLIEARRSDRRDSAGASSTRPRSRPPRSSEAWSTTTKPRPA